MKEIKRKLIIILMSVMMIVTSTVVKITAEDEIAENSEEVSSEVIVDETLIEEVSDEVSVEEIDNIEPEETAVVSKHNDEVKQTEEETNTEKEIIKDDEISDEVISEKEEKAVDEKITEKNEITQEEIIKTDEISNTEAIEVNYPAQSWSQETGELKVYAKVQEGVFPEGTEMRLGAVYSKKAIEAAQEMLGEQMQVVDAIVVDITFHYNDEEIQPNGDVSVELVAKRKIKGESHDAITIKDNGEAEVVAEASANNSSFETDHFTVYGIIGTTYIDDVKQYIRHKYYFYAGDPNQDISTWPCVAQQTYRNGDVISLPDEPAGDAKHGFDGWYISENEKLEDGSSVTIDPATAETETEPVTVNVYARFSEKYKVTLYVDKDKSFILDTILANKNESVTLPNAKEAEDLGLVTTDHQKMNGWKYFDGTLVSNNQLIIDTDVELYPNIVDAHLVSFDLVNEAFSDLGIADQHVMDNERVVKPSYIEDKTYRGFIFEGWYLDKTYNEKFDFTKVLSEEIDDDRKEVVLYAKWRPGTVHYTVEVYLENAHLHQDEFTMYSSAEKTALANDPVPLNDLFSEFESNRNIWLVNRYVPFHRSGAGAINGSSEHVFMEVVYENEIVASFDNNKNIKTGQTSNAVIKNDDSTVIRIYYCLDSYNINFLFSNKGYNKIVTSSEYYSGYKVSRTLNSTGKSLAPEGYADTVLPIVPAKFGEWLNEATYLRNPQYSSMFEAFTVATNWVFERRDFNGSGETVFNDANKRSPVRPNVSQSDGSNLYILVYTKRDEKQYKAIELFYHENYSISEMIEGKGKLDYTHVMSASYEPDHQHSFEMGSELDGYKLVYADRYRTAKKQSGDNWFTPEKLPPEGFEDGETYNFYWDYDEDGEPKPIYLYYVPASYKIAFTQTRILGKVYGHAIDDEHKESTITINVYYNEDIGEKIREVEQLLGPNWKTIKDNLDRTYHSLDGWYSDAYENKSLPLKMPDKDIVLYKKWEPEKYTVIYDLKGHEANGKTIHVFNDIHWGLTIPNPVSEGYHDREGFILDGWDAYMGVRDADGNISKGDKLNDFSLKDHVKHDYYLEAIWHKHEGFTIEYNPGEHGNIVLNRRIVDPDQYKHNGSAPISRVPQPDQGYVFIGWSVGEYHTGDRLYGSGDVINYTKENDAADGTIDDKIVLIAQYAKSESLTKVTYHANYPDDVDDKKEFTDIVINNEIIIKDPYDVGLDYDRVHVINGDLYRFEAWTNSPGERIYSGDSSREYFYPHEKAAAGQNENHLYAVWKKVEGETIDFTVEKIWVDNENKEGKRPESITVHIYADGELLPDMQPLVLYEGNGWTGAWNSLAIRKETQLIKYEVKELDQEGNALEEGGILSVEGSDRGYKVAYSNHGYNCVVTNTREPVKPREDDHSFRIPKTGIE